MRAVVQRVTKSHVSVAEETVAGIGCGLLVLLGVAKGDTHKQAFQGQCLARLQVNTGLGNPGIDPGQSEVWFIPVALDVSHQWAHPPGLTHCWWGKAALASLKYLCPTNL